MRCSALRSEISRMCVSASICLFSRAEASYRSAFEAIFMSRPSCLLSPCMFPEKSFSMFRTVFPYSSLPTSPLHTPGHRPICRLKHDLHFLEVRPRDSSDFLEVRPRDFSICASHGTHLSRYGNILRTILSASASEPPCGKGPNSLRNVRFCPLKEGPPPAEYKSRPRTRRTRGKSSLVMTR